MISKSAITKPVSYTHLDVYKRQLSYYTFFLRKSQELFLIFFCFFQVFSIYPTDSKF